MRGGATDEAAAAGEEPEGLLGTLNIRGCKIETAEDGNEEGGGVGGSMAGNGTRLQPPPDFAFRFKVGAVRSVFACTVAVVGLCLVGCLCVR